MRFFRKGPEQDSLSPEEAQRLAHNRRMNTMIDNLGGRLGELWGIELTPRDTVEAVCEAMERLLDMADEARVQELDPINATDMETQRALLGEGPNRDLPANTVEIDGGMVQIPTIPLVVIDAPEASHVETAAFVLQPPSSMEISRTPNIDPSTR